MHNDDLFTAVVCECRTCKKEYYEHKSRADLKGFCTARCQHEKAALFGYKKSKKPGWTTHSEYEALKRVNQVGSVVVRTFQSTSPYRLPKLC